jgi:hypothetical protein
LLHAVRRRRTRQRHELVPKMNDVRVAQMGNALQKVDAMLA